MTQIPDGTSNTYLVGEKYLNPDVTRTGAIRATTKGRTWGLPTMSAVKRTSLRTRIGPCGTRRAYGKLQHFGSAHAVIFNMAMVDGSVHPVNYSIAVLVHRNLGNRKDGQ